jgi:hypothetical protein
VSFVHPPATVSRFRITALAREALEIAEANVLALQLRRSLGEALSPSEEATLTAADAAPYPTKLARILRLAALAGRTVIAMAQRAGIEALRVAGDGEASIDADEPPVAFSAVVRDLPPPITVPLRFSIRRQAPPAPSFRLFSVQRGAVAA